MPGQKHSAVSCAKIAELIKMAFGLWTETMRYMGVHIVTTWPI